MDVTDDADIAGVDKWAGENVRYDVHVPFSALAMLSDEFQLPSKCASGAESVAGDIEVLLLAHINEFAADEDDIYGCDLGCYCSFVALLTLL